MVFNQDPTGVDVPCTGTTDSAHKRAVNHGGLAPVFRRGGRNATDGYPHDHGGTTAVICGESPTPTPEASRKANVANQVGSP